MTRGPQLPATAADLRDYYASRILATLAASSFEPSEKLVRRAFALADLALAERER
jgi:hypothetical protein